MNLSDHNASLTYERLLKMQPVHQISEIGTEAFSSKKREKFGFYGLFRGKNTDCVQRKSLCVFVFNSPKSILLTDLSNHAIFNVIDEIVQDGEIKLLSLQKTSFLQPAHQQMRRIFNFAGIPNGLRRVIQRTALLKPEGTAKKCRRRKPIVHYLAFPAAVACAPCLSVFEIYGRRLALHIFQSSKFTAIGIDERWANSCERIIQPVSSTCSFKMFKRIRKPRLEPQAS